MGGDNAPLEIIKGTIAASKEYNASFILVGNAEKIKSIAAENGFDLRRFEIVDTDVSITMEDDPLCVVRSKKDSSMISKNVSILALNSLILIYGKNWTS